MLEWFQLRKEIKSTGLGKRGDQPGIMYVKDRRADSICETWLAFLVTKSS
jgi:hypothetical protein